LAAHGFNFDGVFTYMLQLLEPVALSSMLLPVPGFAVVQKIFIAGLMVYVQ
jgi:hypothetical protein